MNKLKIFCAYHKPARFFDSDVIAPIQAGAAVSGVDLGILRDDTGENISRLNGGYSELTAQYWVWKNYMPLHPELEYVGFCHYRRFLDFWAVPLPPQTDSYRDTTAAEFADTLLPQYTEQAILSSFPAGTDVVVPAPLCTGSRRKTMLADLFLIFRGYGLDETLAVLRDSQPREYLAAFIAYLRSHREYHGLTYLMRKDVFCEYAAWLFGVLGKIHDAISRRRDYNPRGRIEGYIAEALENVWLECNRKASDLAIHECGGVKIVDKVKPQSLISRTAVELSFAKNIIKAKLFAMRHSATFEALSDKGFA